MGISTSSCADYRGLESAFARSCKLLSAPAGMRFAVTLVAYELICFMAIVIMVGCTQTSYQDYSERWPAREASHCYPT